MNEEGESQANVAATALDALVSERVSHTRAAIVIPQMADFKSRILSSVFAY